MNVRIWLVLVVALGAATACGDDGEAAVDATPAIDAKPIDRQDYPLVMKSVRLPVTPDDVEGSSLVFPGTGGRAVNKIGGLTTVLLGLTDCLMSQTSVDQGITSGETLHVYVLHAAALGEDDPGATVQFGYVDDADADPDNTLTGTGQVRLAAGESLRPAADVVIEGGQVHGTGAVGTHVAWYLKMLDTADPMPTPGEYARLEGTFSASGFTGVIGSAVTVADFQSMVYPGIAQLLTASIARCPDPDRAQVRGIYDTNGDDVVTTEELVANDNMAALVTPDVDLDGDGINEHISQAAFVELVPVEIVE